MLFLSKIIDVPTFLSFKITDISLTNLHYNIVLIFITFKQCKAYTVKILTLSFELKMFLKIERHF